MRVRRVLIGGVGYRWMGDASFGLVVTDELALQGWPEGVEVADLGYGALYVAQDLADAQPPYDRVILIAGVERGREPGGVHHYRWEKRPLDAEELQTRIREAGAGVIDLDHLLAIADHFDALPEVVEIIELEPVDSAPGDRLSPPVAGLLADVMDRVRHMALAQAAQDCHTLSVTRGDGSPLPQGEARHDTSPDAES